MTTYLNTFSASQTTSNGIKFTDTGTISLNVVINADGSIGGQGTITTTSTEIVPEPAPSNNVVTTQTITSALTVSGALSFAPPGFQVVGFNPAADGGFEGSFNSAKTTITGDISFNDGLDIPLTLNLAGSVPLPPIISFSSGSLKIDPGTATFTLSRGPVPIGDTGSTVTVSTVNGTATAGKDFGAINNMQIVFAAGQSTATFTDTVIYNSADAAAHINPNFSIVLSNPTNASIGFGNANVTIIDTPTVTPTTDNQATSENAGHVVTASVSTPTAETVTGTPSLQLNNGEVAGYTGGSGTTTLTFTYAVQPGDNVADLQVTGLNLPSGASIVSQTLGALSSSNVTSDLGLAINTTTTPATSVQQEILGLYAALYGRATDSGGVSYWTGIVGQQPDGVGVTTTSAGTTGVTVNDATVLGQAFVNTQSAYFNSVYGSLNDSAFVNALYVNIGGNAGDPGGIAYWAAILAQNEAAGQSVQASRAGLVGQFVHDLVDYNLVAGAAGLTAAQLLAATQRQAAVDNKIAVSEALSIASQQSGGSILVVHTVGDTAYQAATTILQGVTSDPATVTAAILGINNAIAHQNLLLI